MINRQFGFQKTRLLGLLKKICIVNALVALTNLIHGASRTALQDMIKRVVCPMGGKSVRLDGKVIEKG